MSITVDHDSIAELHRLGYSATQIAARVGCSPETVSRWRVRAGVSQPVPENASRPVTSERLEAARRLLADGASRSDVCATLGMADRTLRKYFPGAGWTKEQSVAQMLMVRRLNRIGGLS